MAVNLTKGGKVSLTKAAADAGVSILKVAVAGLGWDVNAYDSGGDFDLDAAAFLLGADGKVKDESNFVYYGAKNQTAQGCKCDPAESVVHTGDNLTGAGDGDDEQIIINLDKIPADVEKIAISVTIYQAEERKQNFGMVQNAFVRLFDQNSGTEMIRYDLEEDFSIETAVVVGELYKHNGEWKFNAIGQGFQGGLAALCNKYGVSC